MKLQQIKAFTLVELIIVITILAILATIGFMSYQTYTSDARDGKRKADLWEIRNWLELYQAKNTTLPYPDYYATISSWTILWYQWYAWTSVLSKLRAWDVFQDPTDKQYYTYSINSTKTKYQLLTMLENNPSLALNNNLVNQTYAIDYTNRYTHTLWQNVWIYLSWTIKAPVQEWNSWSNVQVNTSNIIAVIINSSNISNPPTPISTVDLIDPFWDNSCVAFFKFDNSWTDNVINRTISENTSTYWSWKFGNSLVWWTNKVFISPSITIPQYSSLSFWVKKNWVSRDDTLHVMFNNSAEYFYGLANQATWVGSYSTSIFKSAWEKMYWNLNEWSHIVITDDWISIKWYKNWSQITNIAAYASMYNKPINRFASFNGWANTWDPNWSLDQFRLFNRALTQNEVLVLYNEEK